MNYFPYELIAAANDWIDQTKAERAKAERQLEQAAQTYRRALERLKPRIGRRAWEFFRHGFGPAGLHDGRLLSVRIGDGLNYAADGVRPFRRNHQKLSARLDFLNYEQDFHYVFELRGVGSLQSDLFPDHWVGKGVGDLHTYEITVIDDDFLQLGFLFASGAAITVQFRKLVFQRRRIERRHQLNAIYG